MTIPSSINTKHSLTECSIGYDVKREGTLKEITLPKSMSLCSKKISEYFSITKKIPSNQRIVFYMMIQNPNSKAYPNRWEAEARGL